MDHAAAVFHALHEMELEGFVFTAEEKTLWEQIGRGELPLSAARDHAIEFDKRMREKFPHLFNG